MDLAFEEHRLKQWLEIQKIPQYFKPFKEYGIDTIKDIALMNDDDIRNLQIKPFHLVKMRRDASEYAFYTRRISTEPLVLDSLNEYEIEDPNTKKCATCLKVYEKLYFNPREWGKKDFGECSTCIEIRRTMVRHERYERVEAEKVQKELERAEAEKVQKELERAEAEKVQKELERVEAEKVQNIPISARKSPKAPKVSKAPIASPPKSPSKKIQKKKKGSPPSSLCRLWKTKGHCSFMNTPRGCKYSHEPEWCGPSV